MNKETAIVNPPSGEVGAVIAAAGLSSRMHDFKPMLPLGSSSAILQIIHTFQQAGVRPIVVVTGHREVRNCRGIRSRIRSVYADGHGYSAGLSEDSFETE